MHERVLKIIVIAMGMLIVVGVAGRGVRVVPVRVVPIAVTVLVRPLS